MTAGGASDAPSGASDPSGNPAATSPLGSPVWRIRTGSGFAEIRRSGRTVRRGPLAVRCCPYPDGRSQPPQVAYAIGRRVGPAVVRNRIRRQLRHLVAQLAQSGRIPQGLSLIMAQPEVHACDFEELRTHLEAAFDALRGAPTPRRGSPSPSGRS